MWKIVSKRIFEKVYKNDSLLQIRHLRSVNAVVRTKLFIKTEFLQKYDAELKLNIQYPTILQHAIFIVIPYCRRVYKIIFRF